MTSVEVLAAAKLVRGLPEEVGGTAGLPIVVNTLETIAGRLAKVEKASEEAAALAAYGGVAAAEAGWNALRQHNPKVDRSTGVYGEAGDVHTFSDLPFKKKLEYASIAFGVLNPGAKLGSAVPVEPYRFKAGDRVQIRRAPTEGTDASGLWVSPRLLDSATVHNSRGRVIEVEDANGLVQGVPAAWLTLVREPREWPSLAYVPQTVTVTDRTGDTLKFRNGEWWTDASKSNPWRSNGKPFLSLGGDLSIRDLDEFAPYTEVIA